MTRATLSFGLTIIACGLFAPVATATTLAQYDPMGGAPNPNTQGWTWNNKGTLGGGAGTLLVIGSGGTPNWLFTNTVPTAAFQHPWSFTGNNRFAGNSQEEFGIMMFADDGTNFWHLSFFNAASDANDGIYNGGDPNGPVLANTATKIWAEPVPAKPFDGFHDYAIVDADGPGGFGPELYVDGAPVTPAAPLLPTPSKFPAGTIGFGSLNPFDTGFFQTTRLVFDGNATPVPEPATLALMGIALCGWARRSRRSGG